MQTVQTSIDLPQMFAEIRRLLEMLNRRLERSDDQCNKNARYSSISDFDWSSGSWQDAMDQDEGNCK
jgi:hypothetical protein